MSVKRPALLGLVIAGLLILGTAAPSQASVHWRGGVYGVYIGSRTVLGSRTVVGRAVLGPVS